MSFPPQSARYLKIRQTGTSASPWSMAELNVYSSSTATGSGGAGAAGTGGTTGTAGTNGSGGSSGVSATRIDCGGPASPPFVADVDFNGGSTFSRMNAIDTTGVTDPAPAAVYRSARIGSFKYTIPGFAPQSSHVVRLHMCEMFYASVGLRRFDVTINGAPVLTNFDIVAITGRMNKALVREFTAVADGNGQYVIQTKTLEGSSLISGIEVR